MASRSRGAPHTRTAIEAYSMRVTPAAHFLNWQQDAFGNYLARLVFNEPARELSVVVGLIADPEAVNPFDFFVEDYAEHFPFAPPGWENTHVSSYATMHPVEDWAETFAHYLHIRDALDTAAAFGFTRRNSAWRPGRGDTLGPCKRRPPVWPPPPRLTGIYRPHVNS